MLTRDSNRAFKNKTPIWTVNPAYLQQGHGTAIESHVSGRSTHVGVEIKPGEEWHENPVGLLQRVRREHREETELRRKRHRGDSGMGSSSARLQAQQDLVLAQIVLASDDDGDGQASDIAQNAGLRGRLNVERSSSANPLLERPKTVGEEDVVFSSGMAGKREENEAYGPVDSGQLSHTTGASEVEELSEALEQATDEEPEIVTGGLPTDVPSSPATNGGPLASSIARNVHALVNDAESMRGIAQTDGQALHDCPQISSSTPRPVPALSPDLAVGDIESSRGSINMIDNVFLGVSAQRDGEVSIAGGNPAQDPLPGPRRNAKGVERFKTQTRIDGNLLDINNPKADRKHSQVYDLGGRTYAVKGDERPEWLAGSTRTVARSQYTSVLSIM